MLNLNRIIALSLLAFSSAYGYLSYTYNLLPFERFLAVKPNTMPIGLSIAGIICSIAILIQPTDSNEIIEGDGTVNRADGEYLKNPHNFNWGQGVGLLILAFIYSISLRELGFILCTSTFLFLVGFFLGNRRYILLITISISASVIFWYLVEKVLSIYLRPWPIWIF